MTAAPHSQPRVRLPLSGLPTVKQQLRWRRGSGRGRGREGRQGKRSGLSLSPVIHPHSTPGPLCPPRRGLSTWASVHQGPDSPALLLPPSSLSGEASVHPGPHPPKETMTETPVALRRGCLGQQKWAEGVAAWPLGGSRGARQCPGAGAWPGIGPTVGPHSCLCSSQHMLWGSQVIELAYASPEAGSPACP